MNKRLRKKEYKAILRAKERMNGWGDEFVLDVFADGFIFPRGKDTRDRRAIRKVASAGVLIRQWDGWSFMLPSTRDAMQAVPGSFTVWGKLYRGQTSFEDCPDGEAVVNQRGLRKAIRDTALLEAMRSDELIEAYLRDTFRED